MKDLKFKAWHKREKRMSKPFTFLNINSGRISQVWSGNIALPIKECIILRAIGKKDRKKKDIFEGDIVAVKGGQGSFNNYQVSSDGYCGFYFIDAKLDGDKYGIYTRRIGLGGDVYEVIGNIYENKELTK